jgi:hypothetical protein
MIPFASSIFTVVSSLNICLPWSCPITGLYKPRPVSQLQRLRLRGKSALVPFAFSSKLPLQSVGTSWVVYKFYELGFTQVVYVAGRTTLHRERWSPFLDFQPYSCLRLHLEFYTGSFENSYSQENEDRALARCREYYPTFASVTAHLAVVPLQANSFIICTDQRMGTEPVQSEGYLHSVGRTKTPDLLEEGVPQISGGWCKLS